MSSWLSRVFKGAGPQPESVPAIRQLSAGEIAGLKSRIGAMSVEDLTRELKTFGYRVSERDGHHLVGHARFGRIERHAYEASDLAAILRKEIAGQDATR